MKIGEMFEKPINRDIKGVIKVGQHDEENVYQELNEYVVTKELSKHFRDFFENYKEGIGNHTDEMGVWISGFFGSGKSHFLKILSYVLENKEVKSREAIDFFSKDNKITDSMVIADMTLAANTSTDVILFNIDSKGAGNQANKDPIVDVFMKVFNEMQGFCGEIPFLADLERNLTLKGRYEDFKREFKVINGNDWIDERDDFFFIQDDVLEALAKTGHMTEESARNWAEKGDEHYSLSIEKFAELVKDYCESKGQDHHVVFLVDEVGQYIGEDSKLMLNLQTVTEDLGIMCGGKAWVVVTSQQDIDSLINVKRNDFSKIQARFKTRLALSSANVDEVIRKRILSKNDTAIQTLEEVFNNEESSLKNLITFTSDTAEKKFYVDRNDFASVYPFIPYQFNLLGSVLTSVRIHGASGKSLSEGERSMLALFQESAIHFMDEELGFLIPFNVFYDSLDKFIDHSHRSVIIKALENDNLEEFDTEVLKVLFMIKYVKEIKAKIENLTTLMVRRIDEDVIDLRKKIEKSLQRLVGETLVSKNGDIYAFLTHEEQDINRAIAQENVEIGEIINEASTVIFEDIFTDKKFKKTSRYNFPFNQVVDDRYRGNKQSSDIGVRVITPYYDFRSSSSDTQSTLSALPDREKIKNILRGMSQEYNEVIIHLGDDSRFLDEITGLLKINKYLTKQSGMELSPSARSIHQAKHDEVREKRQRIKIHLLDALKFADIYVKGHEVSIKEKNPIDRINEALAKLVDTIYHKLRYMETFPTESDILGILNSIDQKDFGKSANVKNNTAIEELGRYIGDETKSHAKPSLKTVLTKFKKAPYGFVDLDIEWLVATLFAQKRIYLVKNGQPISYSEYKPQDILQFLTKKQYQEKILIDKKEAPDLGKLKIVKKVYKEFFEVSNVPEDDETLMESFKVKTKDRREKVNLFLEKYELESRYPGRDILLKSKELLRDMDNTHSVKEFFDYVNDNRDDLLDNVDDLKHVLDFFNGNQVDIFKSACELEDLYQKNKNFMDDPELVDKADEISSIIKMPNPYSEIYRLPDLSKKFEERHLTILDDERKPIEEDITIDLDHTINELNSELLEEKFKVRFEDRFKELKIKLANSQEISVIRGISDESNLLMNRCIGEVDEYEKSTRPTEPGTPEKPIRKPKKKNIDLRDIPTKKKITIKNKEDINKFLEILGNRLEEELGEDITIILRI